MGKVKSKEQPKRVRIIECTAKLQFVKTIMEVTGKSLLESKNIADICVKHVSGSSDPEYGILLLNESSILPSEWEKIAKKCKPILKWEYV